MNEPHNATTFRRADSFDRLAKKMDICHLGMEDHLLDVFSVHDTKEVSAKLLSTYRDHSQPHKDVISSQVVIK